MSLGVSSCKESNRSIFFSAEINCGEIVRTKNIPAVMKRIGEKDRNTFNFMENWEGVFIVRGDFRNIELYIKKVMRLR
jgi:hypothetical protein